MTIWLQGTDGWYVSKFNYQAYSDYQASISNGYTSFSSSPATWLDNNTVGGWDYYDTANNIGEGRLAFVPE